MTWQNLLKALPKPANVASFLTSDEGIAYIEGEAKKDDKTNIIRIRNKTKAISEGRQIPPEFKDMEAKLIANAKKITGILSEIITSDNVKHRGQNTHEVMLDKALEEYKNDNKQPLLEFVGKGYRSWGKNRNKKRDVLLENKTKIINIVGKEDKDLFYYSTDKVYQTEDVSAHKEIKSSMPKSVKVTKNKEGVTITLPEKISVEDLENIRNSIYTFEQRPTGEGVRTIRFTRTGGFKKSPLVDLIGDKPSSAKVEQRSEMAEKKDYVASVDSNEKALEYFKLMTKRGWRRKEEFMPTPITKSKKARTNARNGLLMAKGKNPIVTLTLRTILTTPKFSLKEMLKSGEQVKYTKQVPQQVLALLEKDIDKQSKYYTREDMETAYSKEAPENHGSGLSQEQIRKLRKAFLRNSEEFPRFFKFINNSKTDKAIELRETFNKLVEYYEGPRGGLFTDDEITYFNQLRELDELDIVDLNAELLGHYGKGKADLFELSEAIINIVEAQKKKDVPMFKKIRQGAHKFNHIGAPIKDAREFVAQMKGLRSKENVIDIEMVEEQTISELEKEFELHYSGNPHVLTPSNLLHTLIKLDYYYGTRDLNELRNDYLDDPDRKILEKLVDKADTLYTTILTGVVEAVNAKVEHIIENQGQYLEYLEFEVKDSDDKIYELFGNLKEKDLIKERGV